MNKLLLTMVMMMSSGIAVNALSSNDNLLFAKNLYSVDRARDVGDLLTVTIYEYSSSNKKEDLNTEKEASAKQAMDGGWFGTPMSGATNPFQQASNNFKRTMNNGNLPITNYEIDARSSFSGSGSANSEDKLVMTITVRVVDKLENGVLVIRGDRRVQLRNENVNMVVTGLVRMRDISSTNEINSSRIADANIYYETGGEVSRGARPGYVWRTFQWLNPF